MLINILYTIIIPFTQVYLMPSKSHPEEQAVWYTNFDLFQDLRTELTLLWLVQMLIFLHKVSLRDTNFLTNTTNEDQKESTDTSNS